MLLVFAPLTMTLFFSLLNKSLDRVCDKEGLSREFLSECEPGTKKRSFADDITILVLDLEN